MSTIRPAITLVNSVKSPLLTPSSHASSNVFKDIRNYVDDGNSLLCINAEFVVYSHFKGNFSRVFVELPRILGEDFLT